jgi:hypothetical protein
VSVPVREGPSLSQPRIPDRCFCCSPALLSIVPFLCWRKAAKAGSGLAAMVLSLLCAAILAKGGLAPGAMWV